METWEIVVVGLGCAGTVFGIISFLKNNKKEVKTDGKEEGIFLGKLQVTLDNINTTIQEIRLDIKDQAKKSDESIRRLHKRIDDHLRHDHNIQSGFSDN